MGIKAISERLDASDLPKYSIKEWETWEGKWELIEGIPFAMSAMPTRKHQRINGKIFRQFDELLEDCPSCEAHLPINFKIDENSIVHPDLLVVCNPEKDAIYLTKLPNIIVEIVSKSSIRHDTKTKPKVYGSLGIKYYVIIKPLKELVQVFVVNEKGKYDLDNEGKDFNYLFETEECPVNFDFSKIWK
jgi:Uma2 family endonuclease